MKSKEKMRNKILDYIEQLEKVAEQYMETHYKNINEDNKDFYYLGYANSVRATINDLYDILNGITYSERIDEALNEKEKRK